MHPRSWMFTVQGRLSDEAVSLVFEDGQSGTPESSCAASGDQRRGCEGARRLCGARIGVRNATYGRLRRGRSRGTTVDGLFIGRLGTVLSGTDRLGGLTTPPMVAHFDAAPLKQPDQSLLYFVLRAPLRLIFSAQQTEQLNTRDAGLLGEFTDGKVGLGNCPSQGVRIVPIYHADMLVPLMKQGNRHCWYCLKIGNRPK